MQYKIFPKTLHIFQQNSFFFYSFLSCTHLFVCFFSNVLIQTCVHSDQLYFETKLPKTKTPKSIYMLKVSNNRASRILNLGTCFLVHLMTCFCTRLCTSHFVYLKYLFGHTCTLTSTSLCIYYKDKNIFE